MTDEAVLQPKPCRKCGAPSVVQTIEGLYFVKCSTYLDTYAEGCALTSAASTVSRNAAVSLWNKEFGHV